MKWLFSSVMLTLLLLTSFNVLAQTDKSKRPSPPATVSQKVGEATVTINYSQPSVKGRTIGVDLEPMPGKVWRAGANEATVFETDKDILVEGKLLPKGKYGFFILAQNDTWTLIFNKNWNQWGAFKYKEAEDVLRVTVTDKKVTGLSETLTYKVDADGNFSILWGDRVVVAHLEDKK